MANFYDFIYDLEAFGFFDFFLPFLLVFTIIFALLEKTKIFGKGADEQPRTNINLTIAFITGLVVIVQTDITFLINQYLSKMALFIIIALIFMLAIGIFGAEPEKGFSGWIFNAAVLVSILAVLWALTPSYYGPYGLELPYWLYITPEAKSWLLIVGFFILAISLVGRKPKQEGKGFWISTEKGLKGQP